MVPKSPLLVKWCGHVSVFHVWGESQRCNLEWTIPSDRQHRAHKTTGRRPTKQKTQKTKRMRNTDPISKPIHTNRLSCKSELRSLTLKATKVLFDTSSIIVFIYEKKVSLTAMIYYSSNINKTNNGPAHQIKSDHEIYRRKSYLFALNILLY